MTKPGRRLLVGRGKGYLSATGPQYRFIAFLIFVLVSYTILLRVFQKLAEIVQLPIFLPISLTTLLVFIGIAGILYSHAFVGPIIRIRRALEMLAEGDTNVSLRLRESDDPMLKDLVQAITRLCEHSRSNHALIRETVQDLFREITGLEDSIQRGADEAEIKRHMETVRKKQELLDRATKSFGKA